MYNSRVTNLYPAPTPSDEPTDQQLSVGGSVVQFTQPFNDLTRYVVLDVQDADVRVRFSGEDPTASLGHILYAGQSYTWDVKAAREARFIAAGGAAVIYATEFTD